LYKNSYPYTRGILKAFKIKFLQSYPHTVDNFVHRFQIMNFLMNITEAR